MILLNKPEGITSFQALGVLKKKLSTKKVGHTGTLDKFATGLLVILCGKMTKFAPYITGMDKTYEATFCFGKSTTTLDPEGEVMSEAQIPDINIIKEVITKNFLGEVQQIPPDFSAVHINGKRAYQLKLEGKDINIPPRTIKIHEFEIINWNGRDLQVKISCSKGTYIRSIARDLGFLCKSAAYVTKLSRTRVGGFSLDESVFGEDFKESDMFTPFQLIKKINQPYSIVNSEGERNIRQGKYFLSKFYDPESIIHPLGEVVLFNREHELVGMIKIDRDNINYLFVVAK